jgi:cell division protein FtsI/penicillin-binding protein 2
VPARAAPSLRTTIDPRIQEAAVRALGDRLGGIAALRPRTGEILALAGIAFSGLQPPGSTFKIITLSAALSAHLTTLDTSYPYATSASIEGVDLSNAHQESCGGTLLNAFAQSCNSVFAPLGIRVGGQRLVSTAQAFGFNTPIAIAGAATSTIPPADQIPDDLAVGSSAIGQGRVEATALQMAWVASTIAGRGRRPVLSLLAGRQQPRTRVLAESVARQVGKAMIAVVNEGTGRPAAIPGVRIAGKTGTAELTTQQKCVTPAPAPIATTTAVPTTTPAPTTTDGACQPPKDDPTNTDAWFAAYAPAGEPRIAVGVLLVKAGAGADTAAPAARIVLQAALTRGA